MDIIKIHPFDMYELLRELPVSKVANVKRDAFGTVEADGKFYEQTTEVDPTEKGLAYLEAREPELVALYRSGMHKPVAEVVETKVDVPVETEPAVNDAPTD